MGSATHQTIAEIKKKLADLDEWIAERVSERKELNQLLELFIKQFGGTSAPRRRGKERPKKKGAASKVTAKGQIHAWLKEHQGSPKREIIAGTDLKAGTVGAYLSTEKDLFENRDGKWHAR